MPTNGVKQQASPPVGPWESSKPVKEPVTPFSLLSRMAVPGMSVWKLPLSSLAGRPHLVGPPALSNALLLF